MGTIVTLPAQRRRRRAVFRTQDEATILLFLGVRYVRDCDATMPVEHGQAPVPHRADVPREFA